MDTTLWFRRICVWQPITLTSQAYQSEDAPYPVLNCTHCFCPFTGDGAGSGIRTRVSSLEGWRINPYTIPGKKRVNPY